MSQRLYYDDAYTTRFSAGIVESDSQVGRSALVLDKTYFYPESGGQPADRGMLGGLTVIDVQIRPSDGAILHFVEGNLPVGSDIEGEIAWSLRLDHMQQHTGQHMLSQAFLRLCNAPTLSFHLGREASTIDLDEALIDQSAIEEA
jgi:alanyl-tRNA synthetase